MMDKGLPDYIYEEPVFMYKIRETLEYGYPNPGLFTSWFIKSEKGNRIIEAVYRVINEWWRTENETPYALIHMVMRLIWKKFEDILWKKNMFRMYIYETNCKILYGIINERYNERLWNMIREEQSLQKLTYKGEISMKRGTFYEYIITKYENLSG